MDTAREYETHEIRYRGQLLAHMSEADAEKYVHARLSHPVEGPVFAEDDWAIAARRPVELYLRGSLVETFDSRAEAEDFCEQMVRARALALHKRRQRAAAARPPTATGGGLRPYTPPTLTPLGSLDEAVPAASDGQPAEPKGALEALEELTRSATQIVDTRETPTEESPKETEPREEPRP